MKLLFCYREVLEIRFFLLFLPHKHTGQKQKYQIISELNRQFFVYFMLSTGLFDTSLCV